MEAIELKAVCRVCLLTKDVMQSIYATDTGSTALPFFNKIIQCTNIEISQDDCWPDQICIDCSNDLETAYKFRLNVEASDAILRNIGSAIANANQGVSVTNPSDEEVANESIDDPLPDPPDIIDLNEEPNDTNDLDLIDPFFNKDEVVIKELPVKIEQESRKRKLTSKPSLNKPVSPPYTETITLTTIPKLRKDEKPPAIKRIVKQTNPDGSVRTMVQLTRSPQSKKYKTVPIEVSTDDFVCFICGAQFKKKAAMKAHINRHNREKTNVCELCDKAFALPVELKRHMRRHTGEKPYPCRHCNKKFSDFGTRVKHERIHTGDRPYVCSYCNQSFTYANVLKFHMMVHTGEKPYQCCECDKRFIKSHQLKSHLTTHGLGTPRKRKPKSPKPVKNLEELIPIEESEVGEITDLTTAAMVIGDPSSTHGLMFYIKKD